MDIENLFILLKCASAEFGENIALKSESRQLTYQQLYMQSVAAAKKLPQYEGTEAVVVLDMQRGLNYCIAVFALLAAGYTVCPLDESYTDIEVKAIVSQCEPSIVMCDRNTEKRHSCVYNIKEQYIIYAEDYLTNEDRSIKNLDFTFKINEVAFMIASSGSTGDLKLIECTHNAIYHAIAGINQRLCNSMDDCILDCLPLSFDYGLYQLFIAAYAKCSLFFVERPYHLLEIPQIVLKNEITAFPATPQWLLHLLNAGRITPTFLRQLKYISSTGDVLPVDVIDQYLNINSNVKIYCMYGLTECKRVSILLPEEYNDHKGSVGRPIDGVSIRIVNQENGDTVVSGETGELLVSGNTLMKGYYRDAELTNRAYQMREDGNRELHTGDIFYQDEEGFLYFSHRTQQFIKVGDQRISPRIIEEYIRAGEEVDDCAVFPYRKEGKEEIACVIYCRNVSEDLYSRIKKRIPSRFIPDHIKLIGEPFPVTRNGKRNNKMIENLFLTEML